jgi:hypothetical protein
MKVKVLVSYYPLESGFTLVRTYLEKDFEQADKDYKMMCEYASDSRSWKLEDVELFEGTPSTVLTKNTNETS